MVLAAFVWLAATYYTHYVRKRAHGVILFVANGMDLSLLNSVRLETEVACVPKTSSKSKSGAPQKKEVISPRSRRLFVETFSHIGIMNLQSPGQPVPDEAAASTALSCGQRVKNGLSGCNAQNQWLDRMIYAAQRAGRSTGLVTTSSLAAPTPVAFYAYLRGSDDSHSTAAALVDSAKIDVVLGGGAQYFMPASVINERGRVDGRDLVEEMSRRHYTIVRTAEELKKVPTWRTRQLFGLFALDGFYFAGLPAASSIQPTLLEMVRTAIQCLQYDISGYFLVVEHGLVGEAARRNLTHMAISEATALDQAIQTAVEYAGDDALILVTNNFSLGALDDPVLDEGPKSAHRGARIKDATIPDWLTGPGRSGSLAFYRTGDQTAQMLSMADTAAVYAPAARPTSQPAWIAARGFGAERFSGFFANTDLFYLLKEEF